METKKDNWIERTMNSADGIKSVPLSERLLERLNEIPQTIVVFDTRIPLKSVWLAAASIALLIAVNITSVKKIQESKNQKTSIYSDYFSYLDQI